MEKVKQEEKNSIFWIDLKVMLRSVWHQFEQYGTDLVAWSHFLYHVASMASSWSRNLHQYLAIDGK